MTISRWILLRIRNVLNKTCRENQNTHFMFYNFLPKIMLLVKSCRQIWWKHRRYKWRNMTHTLCKLDKQGHTSGRARPFTHPRPPAPARMRKHTDKYVVLLFHGNIFTLHVHCFSFRAHRLSLPSRIAKLYKSRWSIASVSYSLALPDLR